MDHMIYFRLSNKLFDVYRNVTQFEKTPYVTFENFELFIKNFQ